MYQKKSFFLPVTLREADALGWKELDVILVSADAYADHPSFAPALIGRFLLSLGLRTGIIPQPDWRGTDDFRKLGRPRLFFGVTAGNLDSMVALYTAQRKIRSEDAYSENGKTGKRPYLPTVVYTNRLKEAFRETPVLTGGIEASLRRLSHYDFYTDRIRPSVLLDAKADMLVYGNGEAPLKEIVHRLKKGERLQDIRDVRGTVIPLGGSEMTLRKGDIRLPPFETVRDDKSAFSEMTGIIMENLNPFLASPLFQSAGSRAVRVNPPSLPLSTGEMDRLYELPFTYRAHPMYKKEIPALKTVENSVTSHRGCYGGCSFCSLYLHQGKFIQSRSPSSIRKEVQRFPRHSRGVIVRNIGGPTANMYGTFCKDAGAQKKCLRRSCLVPAPCPNLAFSQKALRNLLREISAMQGVRAVFISSGIRHDLALLDREFIRELAFHHTPGHLSVAPEHSEKKVLRVMGKPDIACFDLFANLFAGYSREAGKKQYLMPYFIVGHPGADQKTETALALYVRKKKIRMNQIQEFYPTPMSVATSMYHTGTDPRTGEKTAAEKKLSLKKEWKRGLTGSPAL